jgi:hypothetical protein
VSLLQDDPDWDTNLRRGTGIGIIAGLAFGIYDGFLSRRSPYDRYGMLNIESRRLDWSLPRVVVTPSGGRFELRFDAVHYRF